MGNGRGAKAERGGRVSKIWILTLPGSIWKNSVPWKRECSIFGWLSEGAAVTVSHRLHSSSQAGWGHEQPPALPGLPYITQTSTTAKGHPKAAGKQHSPTHDLFAMVFILHLLLPLLPPQWLSPVGFLQCCRQTSSQAAFWGENTGKEAPVHGAIQGQAPWSPNLSLFFHSLTRLLFLLWKYPFSRIMSLQHWVTPLVWYKMSSNLQKRLHWYKHLIRVLFRFKVQGLSLGLCLLNTEECLEQKHISVAPHGCTEHSSGSC